MKRTSKATKVLLMLALGFFIVGAVLGIASLSAGFSYREFAQNIKAGRFNLIGPTKWTGKVLDNLSALQETTGSGETFEQTYTGVRTLKLKAGQADCEIVPCDGSEWKVEGRYLTSRFDCELDGDELSIDCGGPLLGFIRAGKNTAKLKLYVPRNQVLEKADLEAGVGTVTMDGDGAFLSCDQLDLECGVGKISLCADIREEARIEGGVGEICVTLAGKEEDFNYKAQYGVGSVTIDGEKHSGLGGDYKADNSAEKDLKIECGVGSVELRFRDENAQALDHHDGVDAEPERHEDEDHSGHQET